LEGFKESTGLSNEEARAAAQREQEIGIEVPLPPERVLALVAEQMTRQGWSVSYQTPSSVTFARDEGPDWGLACCLMVVFLIPALIYLLLARNRTARVTVGAYPYEQGSRVIIGGDRPPVALADWGRRLEEAAQKLPPPEPEEGQPRPTSTLAQKLRELADLREAGLITPEEYEAKRRDLLDKM